MAVVGNTVLTYADLANRLGEDGRVQRGIIEMLNQTNEILEDMAIVPCNSGIVHRTTVRTGLPTAAWRLLNYGIPRSKSTTASVTDTVGMLEAYSEVDARLVQLSGDPAAFRLSEARPFVESMNQTMAATTFYGNTRVNPERFLGLAPRFSSLSAASGANIIDAGGLGVDNTSMWLVVWGDQTVHGIYPDTSPAGLQQQDLGEQTLTDPNGNLYQGYRDHWMWDLGLTVRDWRYIVRVANIDVSDLSNTTNQKALINYMVQAEEKVQNLNGGRAAWYVNRTVRAALRFGVLEKIANNLTEENVAGRVVVRFNGIPVRQVDQIVNNEARVV